MSWKRISYALIIVIAISVSILLITPVFAESDFEKNMAGISTIVIGDSYGEMSYGGIRDGIEVDPSMRNDGFANCWTGRFASKLGLAGAPLMEVRSPETKCLINVFEDALLYSVNGRGFSAVGISAADVDSDGNVIKTFPRTDYGTMIQEVSSYVEPAAIRWIIVGGGANDTKIYNQTHFMNKTSQLIESAHNTYPNAQIVLAQLGWGKYAEGTLPEGYVRYGAWDDMIQSRTDLLDADLASVCSNYAYAHYAGNIGKDALCGKEDLYFTGLSRGQYDPVHPNNLGSEALAECLYERMSEADISYLCRERGEHTFSNWEVSSAPSCIEKGSQTRMCSTCHLVETEDLDALGHTYKEIAGSDVMATCTNTGKEADQKCVVCGQMIAGNPIPKAPHDWEHVIISAGFLKNGSEYDQCINCMTRENKKTLTGFAKYYVKSLKVKNGKKRITVKWAKQSKMKQRRFNGYQIRYSTNRAMRDAKYSYARSSVSSKAIRNLKAKKKYYIQVRTYTKSHGITYYSRWSAKKIAKTR